MMTTNQMIREFQRVLSPGRNMETNLYLDFDTKPPLRSRTASKPGLKAAIRQATRLIAALEEGQIGIYESYQGQGFKGYVIKYHGKEPYFEAAAS